MEATATAPVADRADFHAWAVDGLTLEAGWNDVAVRILGTAGEAEGGVYTSWLDRIALSKIA